MSSKTAIAVESLSKCYQIYDRPRDRLLQMLTRGRRSFYREFWALKDATFSVQQGETVGIIGRNGSGKSTLLQMICGTVTPTHGTVETQGRVAALLELGAGFNTEFTGRENVLLNAAILGFPQDAMEDRMEAVIEFSELGKFIDQPVKTYSSGMYARLAFSIAIHVDPEILIIDEALAVGDARFVAKCMRRIKDIKEQGATILFVSHDVTSVRTLCERAIWLDRGHVVDQGDVFPVSGRYMEYMFKDEQTTEEALHAEISAAEELSAAKSDDPILLEPQTHSREAEEKVKTEDSTPAAEVVEKPEDSLDSRPVTHWGSHKGMILSASVRDPHGIRKDVHLWGSEIEVAIDVHIPAEISREHLSIAFSIKDLKGTDLIVSTTHDFKITELPTKEHFCVTFKLVNPLTTGKYLLVAAVENRQHHDIHYYEYFEGAHYFSSLSEERIFGLFHPPIEQKIRCNR